MNPIKLIFLDVDGVLNSVDYMISRGHPDWNSMTRFERNLADFDPAACAVLQQVLKETEASVVISSSWRILHSCAEIRQLLKVRGVEAQIIGMTPDTDLWLHAVPTELREKRSEWERGIEIQHWLQTYIPAERLPDVRICVLDDDGDMGDVRGAFVRTPNQTGLLPEHIPLIVEHLNRPLRDSEAAGGPGQVKWKYEILDEWLHRDGKGPESWE